MQRGLSIGWIVMFVAACGVEDHTHTWDDIEGDGGIDDKARGMRPDGSSPSRADGGTTDDGPSESEESPTDGSTGESDGGVATPDAGVSGCTARSDLYDDPPGDTVVDLGEEGLSEGDLIDPYLEEYFVDGNEVHIPQGTYRWEGTNHELGDATLCGEGMGVVFDTGDEFGGTPDWVATHGTVLFKNITQRGTYTGGNINFGFHADEGATLILDNVNRPDGSSGDGDSIGWYLHYDHAGTLIMRNCTVIGFGDNGLYASAPGEDRGYGGQVIVEGGLYKNNNVASIRVGSTDSVIRNVTIVHDAPIPSKPQGTNGRGIWVREGGDDILVEDVDITFTSGSDESTTPLYVQPRDGGGSGVVRDVRIRHERSSDPVRQSGGSWTGSGIHLSGTGDLVPDSDTADWVECTGAGCDVPTTEKQWVGP